MSEYKIIQGVKGKRYQKDNKFVKATDIPEDVLQKLEEEDKPVKSRRCIICGAHADYARLIDLQTLAVCEEDYFNKTVGELAHIIRQGNQNVLQNQT